MKSLLTLARVVSALTCLTSIAAHSQIVVWDPDGATPGLSVSGDWDTTTPNWTTAGDSGANQTWAQDGWPLFGVTTTYTVTLAQPISLISMSVTGTAGGLTISGTAVKNLILASDANFNTGTRPVDITAPIGGAFKLTKSGSSILSLLGANTYSGGTALSGGGIGIGIDSISSGGSITSGAFGTGNVSIGTASTLTAVGGPHVVHNSFIMTAGFTNSGSQALTLRNGTVQVVGANRVVTISNSAPMTIESNLIDDGAARGFLKGGPGTLVLAGTNSGYLGALTVIANGGTVQIGNNSALQFGQVVTVNSPGTLDLNGFNGSVVGLTGAGNVSLGNGVLTIANAGTSRDFTGVISGNGSVVISNSISQQITGNNTFSGGLVVKMGTVFLRTNAASANTTYAAGTGTITVEDTGLTPRAAIGANYSAGVVRFTNAINVVSGQVLLFPSNGGSNQFDGVISGPGGVLRDNNGGGLVVLNGNNTYAGGLALESRSIAIGHRKAVGNGTFVIGNASIAPGNPINIVPIVDLGAANAITNSITVNQNFGVANTNGFEFSGPVTLAANVAITNLGTVPMTISGVIGGSAGLTKAGAGTLVLSGANNYSGDTLVAAGTLLVNNITGSGTGGGNMTVASDATVGGNGTIAGAVAVSSGGTVAAGTSAGKLNIGNGVDLSAGGTNAWELAALKDASNGTAGVDFDQLVLAGGNLVLGGSSSLQLKFIGSAVSPRFSSSFWQSNHTWKVVSLTGSASNPGSSVFANISGTNGVQSGTFSVAADGTGSIVLSYAAAPLPPKPTITSAIAGAGTSSTTIQWSAVDGITYEVRYKDNLTDPTWTLLGTVTGSGGSASIVDTTAPSSSKRFYAVFLP